MRRPTKPDELLAWWRRALAEARKPEYQRERGAVPATSEPQCGWFKRRGVRLGPWMPARIWVDIQHQWIDATTGELLDDERLLWRCTVNGVERDVDDEWFYLYGQPIDVDEFEYLERLSLYARKVDPREPLANPKAPIDMNTAPPPIFKRKRR